MPVDFLGIAATNNGSETTARSGPVFDAEYTLRLARAHEDNGWDQDDELSTSSEGHPA
jgi:alkanesulfonate monooxygenase